MAKKKFKIKRIILVVAILVILIILAIILGITIFGKDNKPINLTDSQLASAKNIISSELESKGDNLSNYNLEIPEKISGIGENREQKAFTVILFNNSTIHLFLIDLNSGEILMHKESQFYGPLLNKCTKSHKADHGEEYPIDERCIYE